MEVLYPNIWIDQGKSNKEVFIDCNDLPEFLNTIVTASNVERVVHKLSGGAVLSGFNHLNFKIFLCFTEVCKSQC